ncbi:MAG: Spy/CpxP family protein refolding chaperone [Bacteroidales bacterium]
MKLKFIASALCLIMGLSLSAQTNTKEVKAPKQYPSERMVKELNLTPKQVNEMKAFYEQQKVEREKFRQEQRSLTDQQKADTAARKTAVEKRRSENRAKLKSILTPDQYTKYLEFQLDQKQNMNKKGKDGRRHNGKKPGKNQDCPNNKK